MICVDPCHDCLPTRGWPYSKSCHLYVDDAQYDELHAFAARLGLKRDHFQPHAVLPHYDLTAGKREQAVKLGAEERTNRETVETMRWYRERKRQSGCDWDAPI